MSHNQKSDVNQEEGAVNKSWQGGGEKEQKYLDVNCELSLRRG